jgi:hypothetical protein
MLFTDLLNKQEAIIKPSFDKLINDALTKQRHPGDMLIWVNNGFYDKSVLNYKMSDGKLLNPHVVGPGYIGHSENAHYNFIHQYRQAYLSKLTYPEYLKEFERAPEKRQQINTLIDFEETTINLEMLVYLKFWEADGIIKKFYELIRILHSESYDWYFKIMESNRDTDTTGNRQDIIRKLIRDRIKGSFPDLFLAIQTAYKTQIRNAIAHSKYSFQDRNIHIHNFIEEDPHSQLRNITFDEWITIFHITLMLHNEYISATNFVKKHYAEIAMANNNLFPILITEKSGKEYEAMLSYRPEYDQWNYRQ